MNFRRYGKFWLIATLSGLFILILSLIIFNFKIFPRVTNQPRSVARCPDCNIVFISVDTLRADHVHALGYPRMTTPHIDAVSKSGITFTNAVSVAPWTLPSTMSWFTGVYPSRHQVLNKVSLLPSGDEVNTTLKETSPDLETLAEVLRTHGWRTGGFTGGAGVDHTFGFNRGFETYLDGENFGGFNQSVPAALTWISEHPDEKFFVFLHGYDVHGQYVPPGGYDRRFVDIPYTGNLTGSAAEQKELRETGLDRGQIDLTPDDVRFLLALYDEKIRRADAELKKFFDSYAALDVKNETIFIITSDHGEEFYEHGQIDHGHSLYDELLRVPLFFIIPHTASAVVNQQVRSIDIMPTVLDIVNIPKQDNIWKQVEGVSLIPLLQGEETQLDAYPETDYRYAVSLRSIRSATGWKYIIDLDKRTRELYRLAKDPSEKNDLESAGMSAKPQLEDMLLRHLQSLKTK